jgi:plasmid stabilization system protein ParE
MELEVYWLEFAESKLDDIYDYYMLKASQKVAKKLTDSIINTTIRLVNQPYLGQIEENLQERSENFRYLVHGNYKIMYWVNMDQKRIEIVDVFDTRQNPIKINRNK